MRWRFSNRGTRQFEPLGDATGRHAKGATQIHDHLLPLCGQLVPQGIGRAGSIFEAGRSFVAVAPEPFVERLCRWLSQHRLDNVLVGHAFYNDFSNVDGCSAILVVVHRGLLLAN